MYTGAVFFFFAAFALWGLKEDNYSLYIYISIPVICMWVWEIFHRPNPSKLFDILILMICVWVLIATGVHHWALNKMDPLTYITISQKNPQWGIWSLAHFFYPYILLPIFYLTIRIYLKDKETPWKYLLVFPLLMLPSMFIAVYQGFGDIHFMNPPHAARLNRVTGLVSDFNGFGISLCLIFPLCIMGVILLKELWQKATYILIAGLAILCLFLSGSRTGLIGLILFISAFPYLVIYICFRHHRRMGVLMGLTATLIVLGFSSILTIYFVKKAPDATVLSRRMHQTVEAITRKQLQDIAPSRYEMGLNALRLVSLSPIAGWGPGGFIRNLDNIRFRFGESTDHFDNANNYYLQIAVDLGVIGLLVILALHVLPIFVGFYNLRLMKDMETRWVSGTCISIITVMLILYLTGPHVLLMDVLWILTAYMAFLSLFSFQSRVKPIFNKTGNFIGAIGVFLLTAIFTFGSYQHSFGKDGYRSLKQKEWWPYPFEKNCYPLEKWKIGPVRWCKDDAVLQVPIHTIAAAIRGTNLLSDGDANFEAPDNWVDHGNHTATRIADGNAHVGDYALKIETSGSGSQTDYARLPVYDFYYEDGYDNKMSFYAKSITGPMHLMVRSGDDTWGDFMLNDTYQKYEIAGSSKSKNHFLFLLGKAGTIYVDSIEFISSPKLNIDIRIILLHPDILTNHVTLRFGGRRGVEKEVIVGDNTWRTISVPISPFDVFKPAIPDPKAYSYLVLSFSISRNWIPKEWQINNDNRTLGIGILVPNS